MPTPTEIHNALAREFVMRTGKECKSYGEVMVVLESVILGSMRLNCKLFNLKPHVASALVEGAIQRAIERFTKEG